MVVTFMAMLEASDEVRETLAQIVPGIELHAVDYREDHALRNARAQGRATIEDRAGAPQLSDDDWALLERSDALVVLDVPDGLLERAGNLRWVQAMSAGTEHLDVAWFHERGVTLTNGAGLAAAPIADFVLGRLIEVWRGFRTVEANQQARRWELVMGRRLEGSTLGIVGLGSIGRAVAVRARAFGMRVIANRRSASAGDIDPDVHELFTVDELDEMLGQCDAVVLSVAATHETVGLFDETRIRAMKPGSVLCNVALGSLVDEAALIRALTDAHLQAAILDATAEEPLPRDSPLWDAPNCYLSPHMSAAGDGYAAALLELVKANLRGFAAGETLRNVVA